jgi:putative endonuclease
VKTRSVNYLVSPQEAVNYRKQNLIVNAADGYMRHFQRDENARLDVITVLHNNGIVEEVEHIENAYYPRVKTY